MNRFAVALAVFALAACSNSGNQANQARVDADLIAAAPAYEQVQIATFEEDMRYDDRLMTYGHAAVNCGLRDQNWLTAFGYVYGNDYNHELARVRLSLDQQAVVQTYADADVADPTPPAYVCMRISKDPLLTDMDHAVVQEYLSLAAQKRKAEQDQG